VTVLVRDVVDELQSFVRPSLWRFCSLVGRSGGHTLLEFRTSGRTTMGRPRLDPDTVQHEIRDAGGTIVDRGLPRRTAATTRWEVSWR
jgi:hypothetical protein